MHILLSTFGPFRDVKENITEKIAESIARNWPHKGDRLTVLNLPVKWSQAQALLEEALGHTQPDVTLSMGHAESYSAITAEARYFNVAVGEDHAGNLRANAQIKKEGPETYEPNIDANALVAHLTARNLPAQFHAGVEGMNYLCNFAAYIAMHHITKHGLPTKFIFLHIPPPGEISYETLVQGLEETIIFLRNH